MHEVKQLVECKKTFMMPTRVCTVSVEAIQVYVHFALIGPINLTKKWSYVPTTILTTTPLLITYCKSAPLSSA